MTALIWRMSTRTHIWGFRGSREALLVRLFEDENLSEEELRRVHELLAQHGRGGRR